MSLKRASIFCKVIFLRFSWTTFYRMSSSLLNFRQPRTVMCLALVALLHGLALTYLQLHARKLWPASSPQLPLPTISLRLLPLVLESISSHTPSAPLRQNGVTSQRLATPVELVYPAEDASVGSPVPPSSAISQETSEAPLNLNLSQRDLTAATARKLPGPLPTHMMPGAWERFVKTLGPTDEIKEERLSINRVRIHTKHGCYELEQTANKRIDPFNWSPQFVTNCRY